jgi:hypothetical protein
VERLKGLRFDLIRLKAGLEPLSWIRKNRNGKWYGVIGALFRYSEKSEKAWKKTLIALSCFTGFQPIEPTLQHLEKMYKSVAGSLDPHDVDLNHNVSVRAQNRLGLLTLGEPTPLLFIGGSPGKYSPGIKSSVPQTDFLEEEIEWMIQFDQNRSFIEAYYALYRPVLEGLDVDHFYLTDKSKTLPGKMYDHPDLGMLLSHGAKATPPIVGNVVPLMKDGGWKVRWIANPLRLHQTVLKPLGDALFFKLRTLPWDCTYNQERPIKKIQEYLRTGKSCHAVDLTAATDSFPLSMQIEVLKSIFPYNRGDVDLFRDLSRGLWRTPYGLIRWSRGQPMGLYPSFASFALAHGMLLLELNEGVFNDDFFILGDDVLILNDKLNQRYRESLRSLGCPVDEVKSLSSTKLTEFAGKVITADHIYPKFKIGSSQTHEDAFVDLLRTYGQGIMKFFEPHLQRMTKEILNFTDPWGPNLSSGPTKSYLTAVKDTLKFGEVASGDEGGKLHVSFHEMLIERLNPSRDASLWHRLFPESVADLKKVFEKKLDQAQKHTPIPLFHESLTDVFQLMGVNPGLPSKGLTSLGGRRSFFKVLRDMFMSHNDRESLKSRQIDFNRDMRT